MAHVLRRFIVLSVGVFFTLPILKAQQLLGSTGLLNIPTADMKPAATFTGGASVFSKDVMHGTYNNGTGLYHVSFTPFPFVEGTLRETFVTVQRYNAAKEKVMYYNQDRSSTIRVRPIAERPNRWWPSVVIGTNDIYAIGDSPYSAIYAVATKHFNLGRIGRVGLTLGYSDLIRGGNVYNGAFGGIDYQPLPNQPLHIMADYDTRGFNVGVSGQLWKAMNFFAYTTELKGWALGLSYQHTIKF